MTFSIKALALLAIMSVPTVGLAQEASDDSAPDDGLAIAGDPLPNQAEGAGEPQVGEQYLVEVFGDWALRCLKTESGKDPCQLYQLLLDSDGNAVAEMTIFKLPEGGRAIAGSTIVAPLETLLTQNVRLAVDAGEAAVYPFSFCTGAGCVARVGFTEGEVNAFKRGNAATLTIVPAGAPDTPVELTVSLSGFTAGFDALPIRATN